MPEAVFLSASVPDPKRAPIYAETADTVAITAAVSALVHVVLGRRLLVWGGHPAITPMIGVVAHDIGIEYGSWVRLYQSRFFEDDFPEDNEQFQNITYVEKIGEDREKSLSLMRKRMFADYNFSAAVFIGGMSGILDEFELFRRSQPDSTIVPLLSTGGATHDIGGQIGNYNKELEDDLDYVTLLHKYLDISVREERFANPMLQPDNIEERFWRPK